MFHISLFSLLFTVFVIEKKVECFSYHDPLMVLTPDSRIQVKEGESLEVNCSVNDSAQAEKWQIPHWIAQGKVVGTVPQNRTSYNTVTLFFQKIHKSDAGIYECIYNITQHNAITKKLVITVDALSDTGATCGSNQFKCEGSSHCIAIEHRCNGKDDCIDSSDEINCYNECDNKFRCLNGKCIDQALVCDMYHIDHCGDASDEYCQLLSLTDQKKEAGNTTIDATKTQDDHMTWLKTTLYVVIGCTVSVVFLISVIVVAVFRIRMKRNAVRRTYHSERSRRGNRDHDTSPVNYQAVDPFLNMAPSANYGNIIVNVNNGIQYVPGAEFSEFAIMEAPPSYSDVEQEIFDVQNIPPPDYSTIDRNPLRVNGVIPTPSSVRQPTSAQSNPTGSRHNHSSHDSRPRTQNAAVQTLTHRSQRPRSQPATDSLPRQANLNVQAGQILLSTSPPSQVSDGEITVQGGQILFSNTPRPVSTHSGNSDNENVSVSSRPPSAVLQIQNGQIMLSNPNLHVEESDQPAIRPVSVVSRGSVENCQNCSETDPLLQSRNPQVPTNRNEGQCNVLQEPVSRASLTEQDLTDTDSLQCSDRNPLSNIQINEGQILLADGSSPSVMSGCSSGAQNRGQLDVCEGQIVFK